MPRRDVPTPTALQKGVVDRLKKIIKGVPHEKLHENYGGDKVIGVLTFDNEPKKRLKTIVTIGLVDYSISTNDDVAYKRAELVTRISSRSKNMDLVLSSCACFIMDGEIAARPYQVWEEKCGQIEGTKWPHIFLTDAERIDDKFGPFEVSGQPICWLFATMISDSEADFAGTFGGPALEERLAALGTDRFNLNRPRVA